MVSVTDWARDLLISRGGLIEDGQEADVLRALLPAEVANALAPASGSPSTSGPARALMIPSIGWSVWPACCHPASW
jgi:hypothetical protein